MNHSEKRPAGQSGPKHNASFSILATNDQSGEFIGEWAKARQCAALLALLKVGPVSTVVARELLGVSHPAARVHDLRKQGFTIQTRRTQAVDAWGRSHTVASYHLLEGPA